MNPDLVTLIIISFNSSAIIELCLHELLESAEFPTLLIDNASPDHSATSLTKHFPQI